MSQTVSSPLTERVLPRWFRRRITPWEAVGLKPLDRAARQCRKAVFGDEHSLPTRFGPSSMRMFKPIAGPATWLGWAPRRAPILNYFNRNMTDRRKAWDVRATQTCDFKGTGHTYNSHNGTDIVLPIGTKVVAPAAGRVSRVDSMMHRGGVKVTIDHGQGLITIVNHLSRATVTPGAWVERGDVVALSGFSGIDGLLFIPWVPPHVHFHVLLNGECVDPFARDGEDALWLDNHDPRPPQGGEPDVWQPTEWSQRHLMEMARSCTDPEIREELLGLEGSPDFGVSAAFWRVHAYPSFDSHPDLTETTYPRTPRLSLPVHLEELDGLVFP